MKHTAFEKDSNSPLAELFLAVRDYLKICIGNNVIEKQNENTTTFFTKDGGYCYIKAYDEYIHIGWLRGKHLKDKYSLLSGTAKTIRGQKIVCFDKTTRETIRYYVEQTVMFLIEYNELKKIRNHIKNKIQLSL